MKPFKEAEIKTLLSQYTKEEISFSRMVEIMNEKAIEKMLIEVNDIFEKYEVSKNKEGGYCKILRNKKKWLELLLFKADEKVKAAWYVVADNPIYGWTLKAKEKMNS